MAEKDEIPTVLIASPKLRTQETAQAIASAIEDAGFAKPEIQTDVSIGPHMSIRSTLQSVASDKAMVRVGIVSHHETIAAGLRVLDRPDHPDPWAQGEMRILK